VTIARETSEVPGEQETPATGLGPKELLVMISAIMALMALAIDLLLPAFDDIREAFGLDPDSTQISQVITVFFLGLAIAQLVWGPLADRYGRKPILYAGIAVYVAGAIGSAFSPTLNWLLISRFVWGVGAAGSRVVATAIIRDSFEGTRMAKAMSQIMAVFVMAPVFAPSIGAGLIIVFSWRAIFWFCVVWSVIIVLWSTRLPETLAPESRRPLELRSITSGFGTVLRNPITSGYTLATLFLQGVFTAYLGSSERLIGGIFGRPDQFPIVFGAIAILFAVGAVINGQVVGTYGMKRLIHVMMGAVLIMSLLLVAVSLASNGSPNFWIFMPMLGVLLAMFMFLMPNLNTAALEPMGDLAGTASSLTGAGRIAGGALLGAVVDSQVTNTTTPFAVAIVIFALGAIASIIWAERGERAEARLR
jgi:DHA1 family bicyclomycin/chloramphenicol resistance-like MFS transporter